MKASSISNPIMRQIEQIVQKVNNKAQSDVQHIRQARKDTVVISAQSLYMAEEAKKMKEAEEPTDSQPAKKADLLEEGYAKRARDGYRNRYAHLYDTGNKLRDIKDYCDEAKWYSSTASRDDFLDDFGEEVKDKYLKTSEAVRQYCVELARKYGEDVLTTAGYERSEAARIKKKSAFDGITEQSLGLFDLDEKNIDEILKAIDKAIPMIEKAAENVNNANMIEYNEDLSKYRPEYRAQEKDDVIDFIQGKFGDILSTQYDYKDVKIDLEKTHHFDLSNIKHIESISTEESKKMRFLFRKYSAYA